MVWDSVPLTCGAGSREATSAGISDAVFFKLPPLCYYAKTQ